MSIMDSIQLKIEFPTVFKSASTLKPLKFKSLDAASLKSDIPPQISKVTKETIDTITKSSADIMIATASTNFIVSLLLQGSMQQLFGMIRAMQVIVFTILIKIPMSGTAYVFFEGCLMFAQADIFDGASLYDQIFEQVESEPLNSNFALLGISTSTFIWNSGSFFILMAIIVATFVVKAVFNKMAFLFAQSRFFRRIGIALATD